MAIREIPIEQYQSSSGIREIPVESYSAPENYEGKTSKLDRISKYFTEPLRAGGLKGIGNLIQTSANLGKYINPLLALQATPTRELGERISEAAPEVKNPDLLQKIMSGVAEYAPTLPFYDVAPALNIGKMGSVASRILSPAIQKAASVGGLGGYLNNPDMPLKGSLEGAALGGVTQGALSGIGGLGGAIGGSLAKYVKPQLSEKIRDFFGSPHMNNESAYQKASERHQAALSSENRAWEDLKDLSQYIPGEKFDSATYKSQIKDKIKKYEKEIRENPALAASYKEPLRYLNDFSNSKVNSFEDAIKHNTVLNHLIRQEINPNTTSIKTDEEVRALKAAKNYLQNAISGSIEKEGLGGTLGNAWNNANKLTAERARIFEQLPTAKGGVSKNSFSRFKNNPFIEGNPGNFVSDYLPQPGKENTARFDQLGKMIGDPVEAGNIIKQNYFKDSLNESNVDPSKFLTLYRKLSDKDKNYLFNEDQTKQIRALDGLVKNHKGPLHTAFWYHSIPAILGSLIGHQAGIPFIEGGLLGYGTGHAIERILPHAFKNKSLYESAINKLLNQSHDMSAKENVSPLTKLVNTQLQGNQDNGY